MLIFLKLSLKDNNIEKEEIFVHLNVQNFRDIANILKFSENICGYPKKMNVISAW